jgi:hypothetical protein
MTLSGARIEGNTPKKVNVMLDEELFNYYQKLPAQSRWEIIERSLISYLNNL